MIGTQSWRPSEGDLPYRAMLLSCQCPIDGCASAPRRLQMLADKDAMATIADKDLAAANKFYQQKLGFSPTGTEEGGVVTLRSAIRQLLFTSRNLREPTRPRPQLAGSAQKWTPSCKTLKRQVLLSNFMIRRDSSAKATSTSPENSRQSGSRIPTATSISTISENLTKHRGPPMSALGKKQTFAAQKAMTASRAQGTPNRRSPSPPLNAKIQKHFRMLRDAGTE